MTTANEDEDPGRANKVDHELMTAYVAKTCRDLNAFACATNSLPGYVRGMAIAIAETMADDLKVEAEAFWPIFRRMVFEMIEEHRKHKRDLKTLVGALDAAIEGSKALAKAASAPPPSNERP